MVSSARIYHSSENNILWLGHFSATGGETAANLSISGGTAFAASNGSIIPAQDNVIMVLQDHMENDQAQNSKFLSRPVPSHTM